MKYLILFLMLCGLASGAACTYYLGGGSCNANAPYFHESSVTAAACIGADGAPIYTANDATAGACGNNGGKTQITVSNTLPAITAGTYAYVDFAASYTDGWYRVNSRDGNTTFTVECTYIDTSDVDAIVIGGARSATATNLNATTLLATKDYNVAAGTATSLAWTTNKIDIKIQGANTLDASWTMVARVGAATYWVDIWACNSSWVPTVGGSTLTPVTNALATGLIYTNPASATNFYIRMHGFTLNCDGAAAADATYGIRNVTTNGTLFFIYDRITVNGGSVATDGFSMCGGTSSVNTLPLLLGCTAYGCANGFQDNTAARPNVYMYCVSYDNTTDGFYIDGISFLNRCISHHNGDDGFSLSTGADSASLMGCVAALNTGDGFDLPSGCQTIAMLGNIAYTNTAYGFHLADTTCSQRFFYANVGYGNAHEMVDGADLDVDATFNAYGVGSNLSSDPLFVDPANATHASCNYLLQTSSPCARTLYTNWNIGTASAAATGGGGMKGNGGFQW